MDYYPNNLKGLKMNIKIFILSSGDYGSRIVNNIANRGFASAIVGLHEFPEDIPEFIDDFKNYIPQRSARMRSYTLTGT